MKHLSLTLLILSVISLAEGVHKRSSKRRHSLDTLSSSSITSMTSITSSQEDEIVDNFREAFLSILTTHNKSLRNSLCKKNRMLQKLLMARRGLGEQGQLEAVEEWAKAGILAVKLRMSDVYKELRAVVQERWRYGRRQVGKRRNPFSSTAQRPVGDERQQRDVIKPGRLHGERDMFDLFRMK